MKSGDSSSFLNRNAMENINMLKGLQYWAGLLIVMVILGVYMLSPTDDSFSYAITSALIFKSSFSQVTANDPIKVHHYEDTSVTRFDVGDVNLQFHPGFKNPCFLEYINESVEWVYNNNKFVTNSYMKRNRLGGRIESRMQSHQYGVEFNVSRDICGPRGVCRLRCLPYFMLIGSAKCGTTDFAMKARSHPQIFNPVNKELFYWTQFRFIVNATIGDYCDLFDPSVIELLNEKETRNGEDYYPRILGEYTSQTLNNELFWRLSPKNKGLKEPVHLKIHDIKQVNPNVKIIAILRKPSKKLYSSYNMYRRSMVHTPQDFHERVVLSIEWWKNCTEVLGLPVRTCAYSCVPEMPPTLCEFSLEVKNHRWSKEAANYSAEFFRPMYSVFVKDWLSVFPRDQMLFLRTEDSYNMSRTMNEKVMPFLGLRTVSREESSKMHAEKHGNSRNYDPMLPETKTLLDNFYAPFNKDLADLLGDKKWLWNDVS